VKAAGLAARAIGLAALAAACRPEAGPAPDLRTLFAQYRQRPERPEDSAFHDQWRRRIIEAARPLVRLEQSGKSYPAEDVALCDAGLSAEAWTCEGTLLGVADDSAHIAEFAPLALILLEPDQPVRLLARGGGLRKAGLVGHDGAAAVAVRPDGSLDLPFGELRQLGVLVAFYDEPGVGIRKHAWAVQSARGYFGR
jgi:hypothetical protein